MLHLVSSIKNFDIHAADGDVGKVKDFYFDDEKWTIRYFVIDTHKWVPGGKVLLSPIEFDYVNENLESINIFASKSKIKNSPQINDLQPISRNKEVELSNYFGWNLYWTGSGIWGGGYYPSALAGAPYEGQSVTVQELNTTETHLRSINEVSGAFTGYRIHALDGEIGHVHDFIIDDETWEIRYIIVDTKNWLPGKKILVSPDWISSVNWSEHEVTVELARSTIENGPTYDPAEPITKEDEENLYVMYGKKE